MSKVITSPVKRWPGTVILSDPLTFPQVFAVEDMFKAREELDEKASINRVNHVMLPGITACVEEWHLDNFTVDPFPATPLKSVTELIAWLVEEIAVLFQEAEEIPND